MNPKKLRAKKAALLVKADGLKEKHGTRQQDGTFTFANDEVRREFDALIAQLELIDEQLRELAGGAGDADEDDDEDAEATERARQLAADPAAAAKQRSLDIMAAVRAAGLDAAFAEQLVGENIDVNVARQRVIARLEEQGNATRSRGAIGTVPGGDARDKMIRGVTAWVTQKAGLAGTIARLQNVTVDKLDQPGEFRGMTLLEIGRAFLEAGGVNTRGLTKMALAEKVLTHRDAQGTNDFLVAFENVMNKVLLAGAATAPDTWKRFCKIGSVPDFRPSNRYLAGSFGRLSDLTENGEFTNIAISDAEKQQISATTKGNIVAITRKALVNDDLGFLSNVTLNLGRAYGLSIEVDVYALLAQGAGLGPLMLDGVRLFDAAHGNVGVGAAYSVDAVDADRLVMAIQKDKDGNDYLDLRPVIALVPLGLGTKARQTNLAEFIDFQKGKPNTVQGLFRDIVDTPRIGGTRRYFFADPAIAAVLEVVFVDGQQDPVIEQKEGWRTDGLEYRVRADYGVGAIGWRGGVTNAGV